jgi:hypothetical protein
VYLGFFNKHGWTYYRRKKNSMLCKHRFPCNTLTHSINEDLLNIKRKGDPEVSYPLSYVRYHCNLEPVCNKSHLRNDNSNKGTTARLNETRFGPKNKSSPIYLGPKNLDTFWCTGWANRNYSAILATLQITSYVHSRNSS